MLNTDLVDSAQVVVGLAGRCAGVLTVHRPPAIATQITNLIKHLNLLAQDLSNYYDL